MTCEVVSIPGAGKAIVCSSYRRRRCVCGRTADLLCDWKVPTKKTGICDRPICSCCATSPAPGRDLCPEHARAFEIWKADRSPAAIAAVSSGGVPEAAPLTDLDAPAVPPAGVSAPVGRSSNPALAAAKPEHARV